MSWSTWTSLAQDVFLNLLGSLVVFAVGAVQVQDSADRA